MTPAEVRIPFSRSQRNIYNGVLQDGDPGLYLVGRRYRFNNAQLPRFMSALKATVLNNPVHLCVLELPGTESDYPDLVSRLEFGDIVRIQPDGEPHSARADDTLQCAWSAGILARPLVRYTVRTDDRGRVVGLDAHTHHILLDGGATGIIEAELGRQLTAPALDETPNITSGLGRLVQAHRRETQQVETSLPRLSDAVQKQLADDANRGGTDHGTTQAFASAATGVLRESSTISGTAYDTIMRLSETEQVPLNVLVAAAAVAVDASLRRSTDCLLVHTVDNRFGDPDLNAATCLVNSVAHPTRFAPFASVRDVVRSLDRAYVKAVRRRWLREEQYRRMYLAINRTSQVAALTLNFLPQPCAPELRPYLTDAPVTTDIGPVEGMTVAAVLDEQQRTLTLALWNRADLPAEKQPPPVVTRIAAVLEAMSTMWHHPLAMAAGEWSGIDSNGACYQADSMPDEPQLPAPAWFLDPTGNVDQGLDRRRHIRPWLAWLVHHETTPGDVVVCTDDGTDKTIDLLFACHLAGCGYSICETAPEIPQRADAIEHGHEGTARVVDVAAVVLAADPDDDLRRRIGERLALVRNDSQLATRAAYIMPTSGSTGPAKLVPVSHGALAVFCAGARGAYGWGPHDTILQCAPLTSDISVEEIFVAALSGSALARSAAVKTGDLDALASDLFRHKVTVCDLPTAIWHLLCDDGDAIGKMRRSRLRQIIVGGEAIRPSAVDKWETAAGQKISLISTYGPTETTVAVTQLPVADGNTTIGGAARSRLGRPIVPNTVFVAFGEIVVAGQMVSTGYLGKENPSFGTITTTNDNRYRVFATGDRVTVDAGGFPVFAGRKDAVVKISGKRVDTAEVIRCIADDPAIVDVAVKPHNGGLGVWFATQRTRGGIEDAPVTARLRLMLTTLGVSSFVVVGVPAIPRLTNGNVDSAGLQPLPQPGDTSRDSTQAGQRAAGLAQIWSRRLATPIHPNSSLLAAGIGSLDLVKILPETRRHLGWHLSVLDLISADSATNLAKQMPVPDARLDTDTIAQLESDLDEVCKPSAPAPRSSGSGPNRSILVLGSTGILGTGFARAVLDLKQSGTPAPDVVFATTSTLPDTEPWTTLRGVDGVRTERIPPGFGPAELGELLRAVGAGTVVNCVGNTNAVMPYHDLRPANVECVSTITKACATCDARLVHLSTYVVNANVTAPRVTDPRHAAYPYAASKALAELAVAEADDLDFSIVRLPRVLGEPRQLRDTADILISVVDASKALKAYPTVAVTEEVTTAATAAHSVLSLVSELAGSGQLGRGIAAVRGQAVPYTELLSELIHTELAVDEWKTHLDQSHWAKQNPRRWSMIDAWITLGSRLGTRSYAEYLDERPTIDLNTNATTTEIATKPPPLLPLLTHGC